MKVAAVGLFSGHADEGYKNVARYTCDALEEDERIGEVARVSSDRAFLPTEIARVRKLQPDIIHLFSAPTTKALVYAALIRRLTPSPRVVATAIHPNCFRLDQGPRRTVAKRTVPDAVGVPNTQAAEMFESLGARTFELHNGVDTAKFHPVSEKERLDLRQEHDLPSEKPIFLHVGHLTPERNLDVLTPLADDGVLLVLCSEFFPRSQKIRERLTNAGAIVWRRYVPEIQQLYQLADCYVFPVGSKDTIFEPLSVLEALACGIPVVALGSRGLHEWNAVEDRISVARSAKEFVREARGAVRSSQSRKPPTLPSWQDVADDWLEVYQG